MKITTFSQDNLDWHVSEDDSGWELVLKKGNREILISVEFGELVLIERFQDGKNIGFKPRLSNLAGVQVLELIEWLHGSDEIHTL